MIIFPAIDLKDGRCVRLKQGKFDEVTVYGDDPVEMARSFHQSGATHLHMVDLDAARTGVTANLGSIRAVCGAVPLFVQTGGGVRTMKDITERINAGVSRVIIGTAALKEPDFVKAAAEAYGDKIAVGIDAKAGMVAISGWEEVSQVTALSLCLKMKSYGVRTVIYTDIAKDGMMTGPNLDETKALIEQTGLDIIASGGIASMADLENAAKIGAAGAITGQAIYQKAIDLSDAIKRFN